MDLTWYLYRLRKMSLGEVIKRLREHIGVYLAQIKYCNTVKWPYDSFAKDSTCFMFHPMAGKPLSIDLSHYWIYNYEYDLNKPLDWYFTGHRKTKWSNCCSNKINYRQGNHYGDIRINWELNRLQFLPVIAITNEDLAKNIITDWLEKNPYLHGPSYLSSMEVALRWISIYWAVCLFKKPIDKSFIKSLTGLAIASGKFIDRRLSTHSSAGNHLILEAVGLFWIGRVLGNGKTGKKWLVKSRDILWEQTLRQLNPDGTNKEQSFWYLGFVLDALFHYFLLEDREVIPENVWKRVEKVIEFVQEMTLPNGCFPDYGDRDDGFVSRLEGTYNKSTFLGLINIGAFFFNRSDRYIDFHHALQHLNFFTEKSWKDCGKWQSVNKQSPFPEKPMLKTYPHGGMTLMKWDKGRILFRHAPLGLGNTCGHGHADALSVLFYWNNIPVLIDLGSGQYNGDQAIRNFFRSTIAHNTIEIGGKSQSKMLGPFLWDKPYKTCLLKKEIDPRFFAEAYHTGYKDNFDIVHTRQVEWRKPDCIEIKDRFSGSGEIRFKGAFHLGACETIGKNGDTIEADFGNFVFYITFPTDFTIEVFHGSDHHFMGWRSTIYGKCEPIYSVMFSSILTRNYHFKIILRIV